MLRRDVIKGLAASTALVAARRPAAAQSVLKIGMSMPLTGAGFATVGRQAVAGARLYVQQRGDQVAGRKIELIVRDDSGVADNARRIVQEMIVNEKVGIVGAGITPTALAIAQLATQAKMATVVMISGASVTVDRSPYMTRTSFTLGQSSGIIGEWAAKNGAKRIVTLVNDWAPGAEAEAAFIDRFTQGGGQIIEKIRIPLANPDFAPFLQRARDATPQAIFAFVPAGVGSTFAKQFVERGLDKSGIRIVSMSDVMDDDLLNGMGDAVLGVITGGPYAAAHRSPENQAFVAAFKKANDNRRPNVVAVSAYDGMTLIARALEATKGATDGTALVEAMKGMKWDSPRGPVQIDPATRDIVQNIYMRKVERLDGELHNVEFETYPAVKDPAR